MKIILTIFLVVTSPLYAQQFEVVPTTSAQNPLVTFNINNQTNQNYYCRDISLSNVDYYYANGNPEDDAYFYSLDVKLTEKMIGKKSNNKYSQDSNSELLTYVNAIDINSQKKLEARLDNAKLSIDCEPQDTRMNNVFAVDDRTQCGGGIELKKIIFDSVNLALKPTTESVTTGYSKNARFFKLNSRNSVVIQNYRRVFMADLESSGLSDGKDIEQLDNDELLIAAFALKENLIAIAKYSIGYGININIYSYQKEAYDLVKTLKFPKFALTMVGYEDPNILNKEEIENFFTSQLLNITENISIYSRNAVSHSVMDIVIYAKKPSFEKVVSKYNSDRTWSYKLRPIEINESTEVFTSVNSISYLDEIKTYGKDYMSPEEVYNLVSQNVFLKEGQSFNQLNFKDFQVVAADQKIRVSKKENGATIDGFCNIKTIFSDLLINSGEIDINQMYNGRPALITAIRSGNYEESLRLISERANVNAPDAARSYAIDYAVRQKNIKLIDLLLINGADITHKVRGESLFVGYLNSVLLDFANLPAENLKPTVAKIKEMFILFKKYNYSLKSDSDVLKIKAKIEQLKDKEVVLEALELI